MKFENINKINKKLVIPTDVPIDEKIDIKAMKKYLSDNEKFIVNNNNNNLSADSNEETEDNEDIDKDIQMQADAEYFVAMFWLILGTILKNVYDLIARSIKKTTKTPVGNLFVTVGRKIDPLSHNYFYETGQRFYLMTLGIFALFVWLYISTSIGTTVGNLISVYVKNYIQKVAVNSKCGL